MGLQREKAGRGSLAMYTQVRAFRPLLEYDLLKAVALAVVGHDYRARTIPHADIILVAGRNHHHLERCSLGRREASQQPRVLTNSLT